LNIKSAKIIISIIIHISLFGVLFYIGLLLTWGRGIEGVIVFSFLISMVSFILNNHHLVNKSESEIEERDEQKEEERGFLGKVFLYLVYYPSFLLFIFCGIFVVIHLFSPLR